MTRLQHTVAERLVDLLVRGGTEITFGFPGETTLPYYIALQRRDRDIRHILARCPGCAGYMADGYARISGRLGVCDAPGGIGSPHVAPALHEAWNSSVPLLFCASGVARAKRGRWSTSQCNQQALFGAVTKRTFLVDDSLSLDRHFSEAIVAATSPPTGPIFLEVAADILAGPLSMGAPATVPHHTTFPGVRIFPDPELLGAAAALLMRANSPLIIAGGGVHLASANGNLTRFVDASHIDVATTLNGKNALPETHPRSLGVTGAKGHAATNGLVQSADCLLVLGSKLGDKSTNGYSWPRDGQVVIQVDSNPAVLSRRHESYLPVLSDIAAVLDGLAGQIVSRAPPVVHGWPPPFWPTGLTAQLCEGLSRHFPDNAVLVADASVASGWAGSAVRFSGETQRLLSPRGSGSIGYALPAAIGAKFARPNSCVAAIGGDGGFAMAMHEMETASRYRLPITFFLLNNRRLGLIDKHAEQLLGGRPVSVGFGDPDWMQIARSFGWSGVRVDSSAALAEILPSVLPARLPTLVELRIPFEEAAPDFLLAREAAFT